MAAAATNVPNDAGLSHSAAAGAALCAGIGCMAAELAAVRLLAPHFGDSAYVWTNVIGVILAALAAGAWLGGRAATRRAVAPAATQVCCLAAAAIAAAPWLAGHVGAWLAPHDLPLDAAMPALVRGSLVATVLLFAPAMVALGALSPLLVTGVVRRGGDVGRASGSVAAAGTIGSLVGTFAATHGLVPMLGCRATLAVAGGIVAIAAVLVAAPGGRRAATGLLVAAFATMALPRPPLRTPAAGEQLLAEVESRVQYLQVLRSDAAPARTRLVINEGLDSFHSLAIDGSRLSGGAYYDWHALAPFFAGQGRRPTGLRSLSVGDAAGTLRSVYGSVHPGAVVDAVDIDGAAMALGDRHFGGDKATGERYVVDGRVFLAHAEATWDCVHVDAYAHQVYIPAHLASVEFFRLVHARLRPGGVVACNVGALRRTDPVLQRIGASVRAVFGHAVAALIPGSRNALLVARRGDAPAARLLPAEPAGDERFVHADDAAAWRALLARAGATEWFAIGEHDEPLADDRPVLDLLLARSYVARVDRGELLACQGTRSFADAELAAFEAGRRGDWAKVLASASECASATSYLRELCGDARWSLRELRSAGAEYAEALRLAADAEGDARRRLDEKAKAVRDELQPVAHAEDVAARNGALQWCLGALLAAVVFALDRRLRRDP